MINYSKSENSRPFAWKIGAKILPIAWKRDFMTASRFLNHNALTSEEEFLWNSLTLATIEHYFRYEEPYFAWNNQLPTENFRLEYQLGMLNIGSLWRTVHIFLHSNQTLPNLNLNKNTF